MDTFSLKSSISEISSKYLSDEYQYVRTRYDEWARETFTLERYALLTSGVIWNWCVINIGKPGIEALIWTPFVICLLFGWRARAISENMLQSKEYIKKLEIELLGAGRGWEHYQDSLTGSGRWLSAEFFWHCLIFVAAAIALVVDVWNLSVWNLPVLSKLQPFSRLLSLIVLFVGLWSLLLWLDKRIRK